MHHWLSGSGGAVRDILLVGRGCAWKVVRRSVQTGEMIVTGGFFHDGGEAIRLGEGMLWLRRSTDWATNGREGKGKERHNNCRMSTEERQQ